MRREKKACERRALLEGAPGEGGVRMEDVVPGIAGTCVDVGRCTERCISIKSSVMANSRRDSADSYTQRAHKEGYPARSVYKLEEIQKNCGIVKQGNKVLDVGAAPGSWTLYTHRELLKGKGSIVAVDLNPLNLNPIPDTVVFFQGDAFSAEIRERLTANGPYDAIISDAAPQTSGNRTVDTSRSEYLAEQVLYLAEEQLKTGGNLVIKIFQGGGQAEILKRMRSEFAKAKTLKPAACRADSFETYLIGTGFKGCSVRN